MAINTCSSTASHNVATQYAEELAMKAQDRLRGIDTDPNKSNQAEKAKQADPSSPQASGETVNILGERVGGLVSTSA